MIRRLELLCAVGLVWPAAVTQAPAIGAGAAFADCAPVAVGLDTSLWTTSRATALGQAIGQTFLARDSLISRLTLWRPPRSLTIWGAHLFITEVDTSFAPPRPDTRAILLDGPSVAALSDSVHLTRMDFVLERPFKLQRPGLYAFFIQRDYCDDGETRVIANDANSYPYGMHWITWRTSGGPCYLPAAAGGEENIDLIFQIEFCQTNLAPVRRGSWGQVKVIYR